MKPLSPKVNATRNRILGRLSSKAFQRLRQNMNLVELPMGTTLYGPYAYLEDVHLGSPPFPDEADPKD
jgi:hypothetical protein